jgi:hypothetical protein
MIVLGVDPGVSGAVAVLDSELGLVVEDMPTVTIGRARRRMLSESWLADIIKSYLPDSAWIERVHAMPKQGVVSSFNFGLSYGLARGVLAGLQVPITLVTPQEWKRHFHLGSSKDEARLIAARMFPQNAYRFARKGDHGRAEAALLALFGSQTA